MSSLFSGCLSFVMFYHEYLNNLMIRVYQKNSCLSPATCLREFELLRAYIVVCMSTRENQFVGLFFTKTHVPLNSYMYEPYYSFSSSILFFRLSHPIQDR